MESNGWLIPGSLTDFDQNFEPPGPSSTERGDVDQWIRKARETFFGKFGCIRVFLGRHLLFRNVVRFSELNYL